nr:MAG TPA: hypothetical protein [Caudoviricetes sp.]
MDGLGLVRRGEKREALPPDSIIFKALRER